jgi:hypothetical protein
MYLYFLGEKMKNKTLLVIVFALIAVLAIGHFSAGAATGSTLEEQASQACTTFGGTFVYNAANETGVCYNLQDAWTLRHVCGSEDYGYITIYADKNKIGGTISDPLTYMTNSHCGFIDLSQKTIEQQGRCKFSSVGDAYLGGTVSTTGMGAPNILRLQANGKTFKLPVIESSINQLDDGTFKAEYYTIDPLTSQPLVQPGAYKADCMGTGGTAGTQFDITITR